VVDEETGLLVEGREPKAVALAVGKLLRHPGLRARLGRAGRARVEAEFAWPRRAERLARFLAEAAG
jgi:glycosyltransferase involved in cell wall biosynthesis